MSNNQSVTADIWINEKQSLTKFFKEVLEMDIDTNIDIPEAPEDFVGLLYIPQIKGDVAIKAYKKFFGENSVYDNNYSKNIDAMIKQQQSRPDTPYFIRHRNGLEPDKIHLSKSYNDFCESGNNYMIPLEGILFALYYRWTTGDMIDVKGITIFHALDTDGCVLIMYRNDASQFGLDWGVYVSRYSNRGPRQVYLKESLPK